MASLPVKTPYHPDDAPNPNWKIDKARRTIAVTGRLPFKVMNRYLDGHVHGRCFRTAEAMIKYAYTRRVVFRDKVWLYSWNGESWIPYNDAQTEPQLQRA